MAHCSPTTLWRALEVVTDDGNLPAHAPLLIVYYALWRCGNVNLGSG